MVMRAVLVSTSISVVVMHRMMPGVGGCSDRNLSQSCALSKDALQVMLHSVPPVQRSMAL